MSENDWHEVPATDVPDEGRVRQHGGRRSFGGADPVRRSAGRAGEPLPAPGRTGGRGLHRERLAALSVARLRLRPADRASRRRASPTQSRRTTWTEREDGVFVSLPAQQPEPTVGVRRARRDPGRPRCRHRLRHGGPFQPRVRRRDASCRGAGRAEVHRHPARRCGGVRGQCLRQAHRASGRVLRDRRTRIDQPAHRPVRREARPVPGHRDLGSGALEGDRPGGVPGPRPVCGLPRCRGLDDHGPVRKRPRRAGLARGQARHRPPGSRAPGAPRRGAGAALRS